MKRRRNDTAKNEPGNRGRVKGRGGERIHAKGANTEGAHRTHGLHGRAEAEADNRPAVGSSVPGMGMNSTYETKCSETVTTTVAKDKAGAARHPARKQSGAKARP